MTAALFNYIFIFGLILEEAIRFPHRQRNRRERRQKQLAAHAGGSDIALDLLAFTGMAIIPLIYVFTPWLGFADDALPAWAGRVGTVVLGSGIGLLFLPVSLVRTPREERMMLDHFGDAYREYLARTGGVLPRL
jgi:protein-S-isoprenylcysteine O-methyltransferase Ste14